MNPSAATKGASFVGAVGYITHDIGKTSAERVTFSEVLNMRTNDPEKAAKVMAWTAMHAAQLKEAAGLKATGRKSSNPVYHFSLNWEPGEQVSHEEMVKTARSALDALGYREHEAVLAVHRDKPHQHIHVVVNRVHPETGKTHNQNHDYLLLQRWAYEYEKARGKVVCLERAIKHEPDAALRAEYLRRLTAELETGKVRNSEPRPQWEVEHDAPFPKSKAYKELKDQTDRQVLNLKVKEGATKRRHAKEWKDLRGQHATERAALRSQQQQAFQHRRSFNQAAGVAPYSWTAFQADRTALRKLHAEGARVLKSQLKEQAASTTERFRAGQKDAWHDYYRLEKGKAVGQLEKVMQTVVTTRIGLQGDEYKGHLARLFNATHDSGARKAAFVQLLEDRKKAFFQELGRQATPAWSNLNAAQKAELVALRQRFDLSRTAASSRSITITKARDLAAQERSDLLTRQGTERAAIKAKHSDETQEIRDGWAVLTKTRATSWDDYKARRARQVSASTEKGREESAKPSALDRDTLGDYASSRATLSRDYGRANDAGKTAGDGGRSITRKGPSGS